MRIALTTLLTLSLAGCATMNVKSTDGIKAMLVARNQAISVKAEIQEKSPQHKDDLLRAYADACSMNNGWIDGIKLDLQAKDTFDVPLDSYANNRAGLAAAEFLTSAESALTPKPNSAPPPGALVAPQSVSSLHEKLLDLLSGSDIGTEVGKVVAAAIEAIRKQDAAAAQQARQRISDELEKAKWPK